MEAYVELITPEKAAEYLNMNIRNRPMNQRVVDYYAEFMRSGKWIEGSHQGVAFSSDGALLDGQHRLEALRRSGVSLNMLIIRGVDPRVFKVMDTGYGRTISNVLSIEGVKNATTHAAALSLYFSLSKNRKCAPDKYSAKVTSDEVLTFYNENSIKCETYLNLARVYHSKLSLFPVARLYGIFLFLDHVCGYTRHDIESFFDKVHGISPINVNVCSLLSARIANDKMSKAKLPFFEIISLLIKAWNSFMTEQDLRVLGYKKGEDYPSFYMKSEVEAIKAQIKESGIKLHQ